MTATTHPQVDVHDNSLAGARAWFAHNGLSRPREGRILAGVCAAYARRYDMNPLVARVLGVVGAIVLTPLANVLAWILMPKDVDVDIEPAVATSA